jgi:hypothetical protein
MTTTRTCIILALSFFLIVSTDVWHMIPEKEAARQINPWLDLNYPLSKDWVYNFFTMKAAPWLLSMICVIDSRGKDSLKRAAYWTLLLFFSHEMFRFFLNFNKDNYFWIHLLTLPIFFLIVAFIGYDNKKDLRRSIAETCINWYRSGWKTCHYYYLEPRKPVRKVQEREIRMPAPEPKPRYQHIAERNYSPII